MVTRLTRVGPVLDWVRVAAETLRADVVPVATDRTALDAALDGAASVLLSADVAGLGAVLTRLVRREQVAETVIGWIPDPDRSSRALAAALGLPERPTTAATVAAEGAVRPVRLVRDDHGGLLLLRGTLTAVRGRRFGAQTWHDDQRVADGPVRRIEVRPDYTADCAVHAVVGRRRTSGRSVQTACDAATVIVDGQAHPRPVTRWTWYADPRQHWLLRGATRSAGPPAAPDRPAPPR